IGKPSTIRTQSRESSISANSCCWSSCFNFHIFAACLVKVEREVKFGNQFLHSLEKYSQIPLSVSNPRNSPTISIVITSLSESVGLNPLERNFPNFFTR